MKLIIYTDDNKYNMHCNEYKILWAIEGERIQYAFKKILFLPFKEKEILLLINSGANFSNDSGETEESIMNFRYNNRCKLGTILHELSHRIVMEYSLFEKAKKIYNLEDIHELIDLFLYDVIVELYGKEAANLRVEYESNFEDLIYKNSWDKALSFSYEDRQIMLKKIVKECLNEKK